MQTIRAYEQPIAAQEIGPPPLVLKLVSTPKKIETETGALSNTQKLNTYVLYDVLPEELKRRVKLAIETLQSQM